MALTTRNNIPDLLLPYAALIWWAGKIYPQQWKDMYQTRKATMAQEFEIEMRPTPIAAPVGEAQPFMDVDVGEMFKTTYNIKKFGLQTTISKEAIDDNQYKDKWFNATESLRDSMQTVQNVNAAFLINVGFSPLYPLADGKPLFSTSHVTDGGTYANTPGNPGSNPTPGTFNEASLEQLCILTQALTGASNMLQNELPRKMFGPRNLQFQFERVMHSKYQSDTANNAVNASLNMNMIPQGFSINQFFMSQSSFYLGTTADGARFYEKGGVEIDIYPVPGIQCVTTMASHRYAFGISNARFMMGVVGFGN